MKAFRFYHLLLAVGALTAWFTAEELGLVHAWTGYAVAALLTIRLVLGLSRLSGFEFRRLLPKGAAKGMQSPAISASLALALAVAITGTAVTGIAMDGGGTLTGNSIRAHDEKSGHERGEGDDDEALAPSSLLGIVPAARADDGKREDREEGPLGEIHETLGNLILPLAIVHALYLLLFRLHMARFMVFLSGKRAKA